MGGHGERSGALSGLPMCPLLPPDIGEKKRERKGGKKIPPHSRCRPRRRAVGAPLCEEREGTPPPRAPPSFSFAFRGFHDNLIPFKGKIGTDRVSELPPRYWRAVVSSLRGACHICGTTDRDFTSGFWVFFFPFYPPSSPLFLPIRKKKTKTKKPHPSDSAGPPVPGANGPGPSTGEPRAKPRPGAGSQGGVGGGWNSYFWSFSPEEEEEENEQLRLPGEAAAAASSARRRKWSTGRGKTTPKIAFFWEGISFPGAYIPEAAGAEYSLCFSLLFLLLLLWERISDFAPHRMFPPGHEKGDFFTLSRSDTESPQSAPKTPAEGAPNAAQSTRGKITFEPFATSSVSTRK